MPLHNPWMNPSRLSHHVVVVSLWADKFLLVRGFARSPRGRLAHNCQSLTLFRRSEALERTAGGVERQVYLGRRTPDCASSTRGRWRCSGRDWNARQLRRAGDSSGRPRRWSQSSRRSAEERLSEGRRHDEHRVQEGAAHDCRQRKGLPDALRMLSHA